MSSFLSVVSGLGSTASSVLSYLDQKKFNQKQLDLQKEAWAREDNAVQRRMADLKAAGLNPALAAGQGAQSSGVTAKLSPLSFPDFSDAIRLSQESDMFKAQKKSLDLDNRLKSESAKYFEKDAYMKNEMSGLRVRSEEQRQQLQDYMIRQYKYAVEHQGAKEAREWIKSISSLMPDLKLSL